MGDTVSEKPLKATFHSGGPHAGGEAAALVGRVAKNPEKTTVRRVKRTVYALAAILAAVAVAGVYGAQSGSGEAPVASVAELDVEAMRGCGDLGVVCQEKPSARRRRN